MRRAVLLIVLSSDRAILSGTMTVMTPRAHILVVDDDERIAASVRRALAYEGYDVSVAHDGSSALATA